MKKTIIITVLLFLVVGFLLPFNGVEAFSLVEGVNSSCTDSGNCNVCDILRVVYNIGVFIFASMAGIAMIMLAWAGQGLVFNYGSAEAIAQNKKIIWHTLAAVLIIILAWTLVNAVIFIFTTDKGATKIAANDFWVKGEWYKGPDCSSKAE